MCRLERYSAERIGDGDGDGSGEDVHDDEAGERGEGGQAYECAWRVKKAWRAR